MHMTTQVEVGTEVKQAPQITKPDFSEFIGSSRAMRSVYEMISRLIDNDSTVLILGESGTGKELVARAIHYNSALLRGSEAPMITVNCGAIPEELLESELFGHEKGSFTGAVRTRIGKFELADGGTIFLDEIGDMSPTLQVKLLRILQEQTFERVGGTKSLKVNVRVIAATHQDLEKAIAERRFREDLYYRLNVIPIELPPLRERDDDVSLLIGHFIQKFNKLRNRSIDGISHEALSLVMDYKWPGNVRELQHMVERLVVLKGSGVISVDDLPVKIRRSVDPGGEDETQLRSDMLLVGDPDDLADEGVGGMIVQAESATAPAVLPGETNAESVPEKVYVQKAQNPGDIELLLPEEGVNLKDVVDRFETQLIKIAMERAGGVKNRAANLLGLNRTTLVEKLKKKKLMSAGKVKTAPPPVKAEEALPEFTIEPLV